MVRSQGNDASFGRTLDPTPQTARLPHRWWATPGYAALIRAREIAGASLERGVEA